MKTYVIIDGYSIMEKNKWQSTEPTISGKVRIVIVHSYIEEILTDELALVSYLSDAVLGKDYLIL